MSREAIRQEALQRLEKVVRPYDIWNRKKSNLVPMPNCLKAMDHLVADAIAGKDMD